MISMAGLNLPTKGMRQQIASAINVLIQVERLSDGQRKIVNVSEITGMEGDIITMQDIFVFEREGVDEAGNVIGSFQATGIRPRFTDRMLAYGVELPVSLFSNIEA
jgi:pilus assembly protein CpaF